MEMLIVLTIIGLLMGMVIMNLAPIAGVAQDRTAAADIQTYKQALAGYQLQAGTLPTTEQGLKALWSKPTTEPIPARWRAVMEEESLDPWGHSFVYRNPGKHNPDKYDIFSMGADGLPDTEDDIGNWSDKKTP